MRLPKVGQWRLIHSCNGEGTSPVCHYPRGNTALGLCDLFGNVAEWLLDSRNEIGAFPLDGGPYLSEERQTSSQRCSYQYAAGISHLSLGIPSFYSDSPRTDQRLSHIGIYDCRYETKNVGFRVVRPAKPWRRKRLPVLRD